MEYDHRSANSPLHHRATAPLLDEDDAPVNMQQTLSAEAIPVYDTHPHAYAVAIPVNTQQSALASSSFETTLLIRSGQANSSNQKLNKQIVCLVAIIVIVSCIVLTIYLVRGGFGNDDGNDDDDDD